MTAALDIRLLGAVGELSSTEWDGCANPGGGVPADPFTTHRFLTALELSGSVGPGTGWQPRPIVVRAGSQVVAVAPLYVKSHSQGEYVFDHSWAEAWARAGGSYYPKLQVAVPFTPATGRRLLCAPGWEKVGRAALLDTLARLTAGNELSSAHVTFCTADEVAAAPDGWLHRLGEQFHWHNHGYASHDDFLATLSSRKRKALRKERAVAQGFGGTIRVLTGDNLRPRHWDDFWRFYQDTGSRKWGRPYLTRAFFSAIHDSMRDDILLVLAERDGQAIAGALNFIGRDTLYGRYWGAIEDHPCLHFELCYHQATDWAIAHGLARVEAGAQGAHKLARGYLPAAVHSLHHIPHAGFRDAVARFLVEERAAVDADIAALTALGPFRRDGAESDGG